jgi:hypothetical protein
VTAARSLRPRLAGLLACLACLPLVVVGGSVAARADTASDARARADRLADRVAAVHARVEAALRSYDRALTGFAEVVGDNIAADKDLVATQRQVQDAADAAGARLRAIYRSGGPMAIYASVFDGESPGDMLDRLVIAQNVVTSDETSLVANRTRLADAEQRAREAHDIATHRARAVKRVGDAALVVRHLLAKEQSLLDEAHATAVRLTAAQDALDAARDSYGDITDDRINGLHPSTMPPGYSRLYHAAATTCPGLSWTILAAIGQVETGHGRNTNTSSAGARGPMQFMPATFAAYGVDGNKDGVKDILDPADAIFTAAHYLCANKAGLSAHNLANAIWHYNHADWYVQMVLSLARKYAEQG